MAGPPGGPPGSPPRVTTMRYVGHLCLQEAIDFAKPASISRRGPARAVHRSSRERFFDNDLGGRSSEPGRAAKWRSHAS
jgi:hypothetical protein